MEPHGKFPDTPETFAGLSVQPELEPPVPQVAHDIGTHYFYIDII